MGKDFLAGACFTGQQDGGICWSSFFGQCYGFMDGFGRSDDLIKGVFVFQLVFEPGHTFGEFSFFHRPVQQRDDLIVVIPFDDIVKGSVFYCLNAIRYIAICRKQDDFDEWVLLLDGGQEIHPMAVRQFDITEDDIDIVQFQFFTGGLAVWSLDHLKTFHVDQPGEEGAKFFFVVDEEDVFQRAGLFFYRTKVVLTV